MLTLLDAAKKAAIPAKYVLFDSWFSSPRTLHAVKSMGYDVIGMVKKTPKMFFRYNGEDMPLTSIYNKNKKRRGRSRYLLSVMIDVVKDGEIIPAKVVYVRNSLSYDAMTAHTAVVFTQCLYPLENVDFTLFFAIYLLIYSIFTPILSQYFQFSYFFFFLFF